MKTRCRTYNDYTLLTKLDNPQYQFPILSDGIRSVITSYGTSWRQPSGILEPLQFPITAQFQF